MPDATITISLNGTRQQLAANTTLADVIANGEFSGQKIAAALNGEFVPRSQYQQVYLQMHDTIDIVKPVGGG